MKRSKPMIHGGLTLILTALVVVACPLFAAAASQSDISDEKLEAVARAYIEVYKINKSFESRIEAAESSEEADRLQQAANEAMMDVIENEEDVTVQEYNDVIGALGEDDELRERLQAHVNAIQEEQSERD